MTEQAPPRRSIRSYVLRRGHMTAAQRRGVQNLWERYGVDLSPLPHWSAVFGRQAPLLVEIGGGYGEALAAMAAAHPQYNYVSFEVYLPGLGAMLNKLSAAQLTNARVVRADAADYLPLLFADGEVAGVHIFFPDPWPKKRHHKRRLLNADFIAALARKISPGGFVHITTDWPPYAVAAQTCLSANADFAAASPSRQAAICAMRPDTRFAEKARQAGRQATDLVFCRR